MNQGNIESDTSLRTEETRADVKDEVGEHSCRALLERVAAPLLAGQDWAGAEYWTQVRPVAEEPRGGRRTD